MNNKQTDDVRTRFDSVASDWDSNPGRVALARAVVEAIRTGVKLRPDMDAMDFGAGTGLVTLGIMPFVRSLTAVDTSGEMLKVLGRKLEALKAGNVRTLHCDIARAALPAAGFDVIVSSMVLHHIQDVPQLLHQLRLALRPGGWIALADLESEDGTFHADSTGVYHHGFDRAEICRWLQAAGFAEVVTREAHRMTRTAPDGKTRSYPVFLATARVD